MVRSPSEHPTPPRPPCALLSASCSGAGLCPIRRLLGRLGGFWDLSEAVQFSTQVVALPLGLFAPAALLLHPLAQRTLRHFAAGLFGAELFPGLSQPASRVGALGGLSRLGGVLRG